MKGVDRIADDTERNVKIPEAKRIQGSQRKKRASENEK